MGLKIERYPAGAQCSTRVEECFNKASDLGSTVLLAVPHVIVLSRPHNTVFHKTTTSKCDIERRLNLIGSVKNLN